VPARVCVLKKLRVSPTSQWCHPGNHPKGETDDGLDNIGLPYSGINLTYSNAGTIGSSDAEILVQLKEVRGKPTSMYINDLRKNCPSASPACNFSSSPRISSRKF